MRSAGISGTEAVRRMQPWRRENLLPDLNKNRQGSCCDLGSSLSLSRSEHCSPSNCFVIVYLRQWCDMIPGWLGISLGEKFVYNRGFRRWWLYIALRPERLYCLSDGFSSIQILARLHYLLPPILFQWQSPWWV